MTSLRRWMKQVGGDSDDSPTEDGSPPPLLGGFPTGGRRGGSPPRSPALAARRTATRLAARQWRGEPLKRGQQKTFKFFVWGKMNIT